MFLNKSKTENVSIKFLWHSTNGYLFIHKMKMKILWLPDAIFSSIKHCKLIAKGYVFNQTNILKKKKKERWGLLKATKWDLTQMQGAKKLLHEKH